MLANIDVGTQSRFVTQKEEFHSSATIKLKSSFTSCPKTDEGEAVDSVDIVKKMIKELRRFRPW
jgi:DNA-directed RNA polymerase specialized sigma54-like protein